MYVYSYVYVILNTDNTSLRVWHSRSLTIAEYSLAYSALLIRRRIHVSAG